MNLLDLPWLEIGLLTALLGSMFVSWASDSRQASRWGMNVSASTLACMMLAWLSFIRGPAATSWNWQTRFLADPLFAIDELNAPLVAVVALLYFLVLTSTARTKMARFSFSWSLATETIQLAILTCQVPSVLVALLVLSVVPSYILLRRRNASTRVFVLHHSLYVGLLLVGWYLVETDVDSSHNLAASVCLLAAVLVRSGVIPMHCWLVDWFERASFGHALLFVTPLVGVMAAIRLVLPIAPNWVLTGLGVVSLCTALYASALSLVQREARRFFAYLFLSHASLVLIGLELSTSISLTGALCLWFSVIVSLGGFGLTLRALEARYGRLSLDKYHGLYEHTPMLAICFMLTGLASVGFPGTLGFVSSELLVDGAIEFNLYIGLGVVLTAALNGISLLRVYFLLFTGGKHLSTVSLKITPRERLGVLTLSVMILGGGLFPQPGVADRYRAARTVLERRGDPTLARARNRTRLSWKSDQGDGPSSGASANSRDTGTPRS
jgi:NADH-quinone oxidoreductase subunit M